MKKYNVFKVLLTVLLAVMVISFFIPQSQIGYYTAEIEKGVINPINFVDSISNGLTSFSVFIGSFVYILCIGVFYAVIKKSGKYEDIINNTACKFKNNKGIFLVISILTFGLLTAVIGDMMPLLVLVPAFIDVTKKLGYDSNKAIICTIGAIILGNAGSLNTTYINQILASTVETNIIAKIIILVISLGALIVFALLGKKADNVKLEEKKVEKALPITILLDVIIFLVVLGMIPWKSYFGFEGFSNFHKTITEFKVFDVSIFNAFIGTTLTAFGEWSIYNIIVVLVVASLILALIYKLKIDGTLEAVSKGIRVALPYALILVVANIILVAVYNSGFFNTVIVTIGKMKDSALLGTTLSTLSSVVYPDYSYATQFSLSTLTYALKDANIYLVVAVTFQAIYSLCLIIAPTSILVLMGLHYEGVDYKSWVKYIHKFFLSLLIAFLIVIMVLARKYVTLISFIVLVILIVILVLFISLEKNNNKQKSVVVKNKQATKKNTTKKK